MAKRPIAERCEPIQLGEFLKRDYHFPAVYFLHDEGVIVYVGQSKTLKWRIEQHLTEGVKTFDAVSFIPCCVSQLLKTEARYIREYVPTYNQCSIANRAREEGALIPDSPISRVVDGEMMVASRGLSRLMNCSREFARGCIELTGKTEITFADALWMAAFIREPDPRELEKLYHHAAKPQTHRRKMRHRNRHKAA